MNNWNYIRCFLLLIGYLIGDNVSAQTNRALIVTIGNYPPTSGWESIHADNDQKYTLDLLTSKGYSPHDITLLTDSLATKASVTEALANLCKNVEAGDAVFLHFSCHGQQMMDDNGDEEDGLDESMVMYDAGYRYIPDKYEGENHLRDDELGVWIDKLRRKAGEKGRVTVLLDACHSGTANREEMEFIREYKEYVRGTTAIFAPESYVPKPGKHQELSLRLKKEKGLAIAAVFSACTAEMTNYEYYDNQRSMYVGKLTYVFCKLIKGIKETHTIKSFFNQLFADMLSLKHSNLRIQIPYMECSDESALFYIGQKE